MSTKKEPKNRKKKHKLITKGHGNEPTVIEFNLSKAVILLIIIGVVIAGLVTKEIVTTIIKARQNNVLAEETSDENAVFVQSSDGKQVPVPKGYVASQIPGETSVNGGFVIYEDNYNGQPIDWNSILVETNSLSANSLNANNAINSATPQATTENQVKEEEQLKTEQTNKTENTTTETTNSTESTTTGVTNATENTTIETTNKTESTDTKPTNVTGSTNTEQTNTETTRTEPTNTVENNTEETNTKPTTTSTNTISTSTTTTATETETNKTTKDLTTGNEKEENKTESTIESNKTETQKVTETTNTVENKAEVTNTEPTATSTSTTTTESTNKSQKIQNNAQMASNENSIELYADETITQEDINIFNLQKSVNQFVWVPVNDISRIYGVDSNGKLWGKLYKYDGTGRTPLNWTDNGKMSITGMTSYREPTIVSQFDTDSQLQSYLGGMTAYEFLSELEENYYATIKSIKEHGGFYIGRYETGGLSGTAVVRKMNTDIGSQTWYTMYEKTKELSGTNDNAITSMIWGSLWDETLQWLVDSGAKTSDGTQLTYELIASNSTKWGNYSNSTFSYIPADATTPDETATKPRNTLIPTGSAEYTKVNNIYDLAGNVWDWTLEAYSSDGRVVRGGSYSVIGYGPAAHRLSYVRPVTSDADYGSRSALFIK